MLNLMQRWLHLMALATLPARPGLPGNRPLHAVRPGLLLQRHMSQATVLPTPLTAPSAPPCCSEELSRPENKGLAPFVDRLRKVGPPASCRLLQPRRIFLPRLQRATKCCLRRWLACVPCAVRLPRVGGLSAGRQHHAAAAASQQEWR